MHFCRKTPFLLMLLCLFFFSTTRIEADSYYLQGKRAFSQHKYSKAHEYFRKALSVRPGNGNPLFYIGYMLEKQRKKSDAIQIYQQAVGLRMDRDLKEKAFWKIVLYHKYYNDWVNLAIYCRKFLKFRQLPHIKKMLEVAEKNIDPRMIHVTKLISRGEQQLIAKNFVEAKNAFLEAVRLMPDHRSARWLLSQTLMKLRDYQSAANHLRYLIRLNPRLWHYHYRAGICHYRTGSNSRALLDFSRAARRNPNPSSSFKYYVNIRKGFVYMETGNFNRAKKLLIRALKFKRTAIAYGTLAFVEYSAGRYKRAKNLAGKALRRKSDQKEALLTRGLIFVLNGKKRSAERSFRSFYSAFQKGRSDNFHSRYYNIGLLYLGKMAAQNKNWQLAVNVYDSIGIDKIDDKIFIKLVSPEDAEHLFTYDYNYFFGLSLLQRDRINDAIERLKKIEKRPEADYLLARAYCKILNIEQVKLHIKKAAEIKPQYWSKALNDEAFRSAAEHDPTFIIFLKTKGKSETINKDTKSDEIKDKLKKGKNKLIPAVKEREKQENKKRSEKVNKITKTSE